jgi:acyl-CoA synthetase (AMP-forming)/AMP-acid ligase II
VHALNTQKLTNIACSPSIMMSLMSDPDFSPEGYPTLKLVAMGADRVTKELVEQCKTAFRPEKVANGWGMTEGITAVGANFGEPDAWRDGEMSIGHVLPGAAIRVCAPDTTEAVNRGETGELHVSGSQVIEGYYSKKSVVRNDAFYELDGRTWFKAGDAVVMDDEGNIFLTGRFKDLIIRGGENVHPGLIENCLNALPGVQVSLFISSGVFWLTYISLKSLASTTPLRGKPLQPFSS